VVDFVKRTLAVALAAAVALASSVTQAQAYPRWGDPPYPDPPYFCPNQSPMDYLRIRTNDPLVASDPEWNTFWGLHANPGWDNWYAHFYGDFRGVYDDDSGWQFLMRVNYPNRAHWDFSAKGWAAHGHVSQYIAYWNPTFGGQCGWGVWGSTAGPPPYMADVIGYPVMDLYVDANPPYTPQPAVTAASATSVSFSWNPVADRGDGGGRGFWTAGLRSYTSWATVNGGAQTQVATTSAPRTITVAGLRSGDTACVYAYATDQVGNSSPAGSSCAKPLSAPPPPTFALPGSGIGVNPATRGLAGFESWFWLTTPPAPVTVTEPANGYTYQVTASPSSTAWLFGDGGGATFSGAAGYGQPYPQHSTVAWTYEAEAQSYRVTAVESYSVSYTAVLAGVTYGPYPLGSVDGAPSMLAYPVEQAQPELVG
jgi:hypothetical protein